MLIKSTNRHSILWFFFFFLKVSTIVFVCGNNNVGNNNYFFFQTTTINGSALVPVNLVRLKTLNLIVREMSDKMLEFTSYSDFSEHDIRLSRCCITKPESCSVHLQHQHQSEFHTPKKCRHLIQRHHHEWNRKRWEFTATSYLFTMKTEHVSI